MAKRPKNNTKGKTKAKAPAAKAMAKAGGPKTAKKAKTAGKPVQARRFHTVKFTLPQPITLDLPPALHERLKRLSAVMTLPMEGVIRQALMEFADTWEDHHRTVAALAETSDRMVVVDKE
jgi:hypothetical protein